jgi:hypothetical protein
MTRLEELQPTAAVRGILPDQLVTVVSVQWFGSEALESTYKGPSGRVANELLFRHDEPRLEVVEHENAMRVPSGDHVGLKSSPRSNVSRELVPCCKSITQTARGIVMST